MNTGKSRKIRGDNPEARFQHHPDRARPGAGQKGAGLRPYGTICGLSIGLSEETCRESVERLNQILADEMPVWFEAERIVDSPQVVAGLIARNGGGLDETGML